MRRTISGIPVLIFLFSIAFLSSQAQTNNKDAIFVKLKAFSSRHLSEKVYLHFDKPYYATGDTIYFKAYVTMGERHELSKLSGVLHVDLINTANKINQSIKLQLVNGLAWGDFALPDSLPKGNYRIRAYTQWMRNDGNYFEQAFPVGSLHNLKIPESSTSRAKAVMVKPDIQFFPEGGALVTGIRSKIAFKAISENGLGLDAKGVIVDNTGETITQFASAHLGMGNFYLEPKEGKTYKANITFADGTESAVDLPPQVTKGIILSVNNDSLQKASVRIEVSKNYYNENKNKDYSLLIYSGGVATTAQCKLDSAVTTLDIIKRRLHTGIARITLFSPTGEPISERLLFIQNHDQLNMDISSDKTVYSARGKVIIKLNARTRADSAALGHFSVSVIDESKVPVDEITENTILTSLLLTSDLKGSIEQPNYYFTNITDETLKNLDLVMLTHGYRRFEWKQVLNSNSPPIAYQPEKDLEITGTAKSLSGKLLENATVSLISMRDRSFTSQVTDNKGSFRFGGLLFADSAKFVLQAVNNKGKNTTQLTYNRDVPLPVTNPEVSAPGDKINLSMSAYLQNSEKQQEEMNKLGFGKGRILKEVKIRGIKEDDKYETQSLAGAGNADQVWHRSNIHGGGLLSSQLEGMLRGVHFLGRKNKVPYLGSGMGEPMLVVIDGGIMPKGYSIDNITLSNVETIEVLKYASASIYGMQGASGVLVITMRKGTGLEAQDIPSVGILPITAQGFYKAREFYSPKYESNLTNTRTDLRTTIYWNPEVVTDKDGNASFDFYNADGRGTYRLVIEGVDDKGNIGREVYRYKVE